MCSDAGVCAYGNSVFDEYHFAEFVHDYIRGSYFFDIHPPLGKLTLAAVAKLAGYKPLGFTFDRLGKPYGDLIYYPQRAFSALLGSFIPPVMYLTCRTLSLSTLVSIAGASMPLFDMLLCTESRLILTDAQLILYIQLSLLCAFNLWRTRKNTTRRVFWLLSTALFGAFAICTKWTGAVAPGLIAVVSLLGLIFPTIGGLDIIEMLTAGAVAIGVYTATFWLHFRFLPNSGSGDAFMTRSFRKTLSGSQIFDPYMGEGKGPSFMENFSYLNKEMLRANREIQERHPWESKWYEWLYNARGILYLDDPAPEGKKEQIYLIMNPVLTVVCGLGVLACMVLLLVSLKRILRRRRSSDARTHMELENLVKRAGTICFFLAGWVLNLIPYMEVERCTFLYHVLPALQLASILSAIALEEIPRRFKAREIVCIAIVCAQAAAFYRWRAWVYGLHRTVEELDELRLMPRWN